MSEIKGKSDPKYLTRILHSLLYTRGNKLVKYT